MKGKPIRIDWEELESAFENKSEDLVYYLDLVTGDVVLEGEGEADSGDGEGMEDDMEEVVPIRRDQSTRLYVEPPDPETEIDWMTAFVKGAQGVEADVAGKLNAALNADDPIDAFREVLRSHAAERDQWFLFRSDRIHETIEVWLHDNAVKASEPPPWKA